MRLLGVHEPTGKEIFVRQGPFGPYIQLGPDIDPDMRRVPLPKRINHRSVNMKYAKSLLLLPRLLGQDPETGSNVYVKNGKFGPYVALSKTSRSVPKVIIFGGIMSILCKQALNMINPIK